NSQKQETQKVQQNVMPSCPPMAPPEQDIYDPNVYAVPFDYYAQQSRSPSMNELKDVLYPKLDSEPNYEQSLQDVELRKPNIQESMKEEVTSPSHHQDDSLDSKGHAKTLSQ